MAVTSQKINKVKKLESEGSEVLVINADVSDEDQMNRVLLQSKERFGQINGEEVVHEPVASDDAPGCLIDFDTRLVFDITDTNVLDLETFNNDGIGCDMYDFIFSGAINLWESDAGNR